VPFLSSCPLYTGSNYMHYSLDVENETALWTLICYIEVSFKAGLTVLTTLLDCSTYQRVLFLCVL